MKAAAIILAAGRGSRMRELTATHPKCQVRLAGKTLLDWQLSALRRAGIENLLVVVGYLGCRLEGDFKKAENPRWETTNMLSSLLCAQDYINSQLNASGARIVVSYSDIVYCPDHVKKIMAAPESIAITYDTEWEALWKLRFGNPLDDAETFLQEGGRLKEIGGKPKSLEEIHGQYMGLLSFDSDGWKSISDACACLGTKTDSTDMTAFLRFLLERDATIQAVPVEAQWCETDSEEDLRKYEAALRMPGWKHDWRA